MNYDDELRLYKDYAKRASDALLTVRPLGGSELFMRLHGDIFLADPEVCQKEIAEVRLSTFEAKKKYFIAQSEAAMRGSTLKAVANYLRTYIDLADEGEDLRVVKILLEDVEHSLK